MRGLAVEALGAMIVALALPLAGFAPAAAQEAIPTATRGSDGAAPAAPATDTIRLRDEVDSGPGFLRPTGPCGGPLKTPEGKPDKTVHGQVWAGVGTNGYREIGGVACMPLGDNAAVSIAVDAGHIDGLGRRR